MTLQLTNVRRLTDATGRGIGLELKWTTGECCELSSDELRKNCPCAECGERRGALTHAKPLTSGRSSLKVLKSTAEEETNLQAVWAVGNYALGVRWQDGHDTGIFSYDILKSLQKSE